MFHYYTTFRQNFNIFLIDAQKSSVFKRIRVARHNTWRIRFSVVAEMRNDYPPTR